MTIAERLVRQLAEEWRAQIIITAIKANFDKDTQRPRPAYDHIELVLPRGKKFVETGVRGACAGVVPTADASTAIMRVELSQGWECLLTEILGGVQ